VNAASKAAARPRRSVSVLVADDNEDTVQTLAALLGDEGHVVHTITNGALVMEGVNRFKPEVCILDIDMPGKSGYTVAREIVLAQGDKRPVLIAISGKFYTQTDQLLARALGFDYFFKKPTEPAEIIAVLADPQKRPAI
jgi:CheY-like chemotaxis protein